MFFRQQAKTKKKKKNMFLEVWNETSNNYM